MNPHRIVTLSASSAPYEAIDFAKWDDGTPASIIVETPCRNTPMGSRRIAVDI